MALGLPQRFPPGFRLIDGSQLNQLVDAINNGALTNASYFQVVAAAALVDGVFFVAPRAYQIVGVTAVYSVTNGATMTAQVVKDTGTDAPGAGTDLLSTALNLNTTANVVINGALVGTVATTRLAAGDRLSVDFSAAGTNLVGLVITVYLAPLVTSV